MSYKHGSFGSMSSTQDLVNVTAGTLPVYFGILPVHQLMDYSGTVNKPILVSGYDDAISKVGYNDENWKEFDLCEAIHAHFKNNIQKIGPIVLVNVLDPDKMKKSAQTSSVTFVNNQAVIESDKIILKSISITDKILGVDFSVEYSANGAHVIINDLKAVFNSTPVTVTYDIVDISLVTEEEIIGGTSSTTGVKTGISVVDLVYQTYHMVPTILDSPGWSHYQNVDAALKSASQLINGHWYAWVNSNLISNSNANTISKAKTWKTTNAYTGNNESPSWPMAKNVNRIFHLSTLTTVTMQWVDYQNRDVPHETPSNKPIDITGLCLADGTDIVFDQLQANDLNSKGIRTAICWGGQWVLWGPHTGEYEYGKTMDVRNKFDSTMRMMYYILNNFQLTYGSEVDKPMFRSRIDTILNNYQEQIDSLISEGKLLYGLIQFTQASNPTSDLIEGNFNFDITTTTTPPGKSINARLQYTTKGLSVLFGGGK